MYLALSVIGLMLLGGILFLLAMLITALMDLTRAIKEHSVALWNPTDERCAENDYEWN